MIESRLSPNDAISNPRSSILNSRSSSLRGDDSIIIGAEIDTVQGAVATC